MKIPQKPLKGTCFHPLWSPLGDLGVKELNSIRPNSLSYPTQNTTIENGSILPVNSIKMRFLENERAIPNS
jgi:hypothetical protein